MRTLGLVVAVALAGSLARPAPAGAAGNGGGGVGDLARTLRTTMDGLRFQEVLDLAPPGSAQARSLASLAAGAGQQAVDDGARDGARDGGRGGDGARDGDGGGGDGRDGGRGFDGGGGAGKEATSAAERARALATAAPAPISQQPQLDVTVIELDRHGRPVSSGTVLMSPRYPHGRIVPVDRDLHTDDVRWRQWDDAGWYADRGQGSIDVVPGRENASADFMLPYPASVLKLMVAFGVLRLVDQGEIGLDDTYDYRPTATSALCGGPSSDTVRGHLDASLTWSSNAASCALVKLLHDHGAVDGLNRTFQELGLETLRLKDTNPANGGRWSNPITMSSLDTAKLLLLVNGAPGTVWRAPGGRPVTRDVLSASSRGFLRSTLADQGLNEVLSTTNWCGRDYPARGIPQVTPARWVGPDGTVTVAGAAYRQDVRPCDRSAQVTFAHKTGLVSNSGADAGIVTSLPGRPWRSYIIAMFSNLGDQYRDADRPPTEPGTAPVSYTQKLAELGRAMDRYAITSRAARREGRRETGREG